MRTLAITTMGQAQYDLYGKQFVESAEQHLKVPFIVYSEHLLPTRATHLVLHEEFAQRNSHRPVKNFKYDAVRFCYKPMAICQCVDDYVYEEYDRLLWIDADTHFLKDITEEWITENLWDKYALLNYFGRPNYHSETGILLFNLRHLKLQEYLTSVHELYTTDQIYLLKEWHDSYVWDWTRQQYEAQGVKFNNIAQEHGKVPGGHIIQYMHGDRLDHKKGSRRKQQGYSHEKHKG